MPKGSFVEHNPSASTLAGRRYRERHPDRVAITRNKNRKYNREYGWRYRDELRIEMLTYYGPMHQLRCSWADCSVTDPDMLVLDHVEDNGAEEKRSLGGSAGRGWNFYRLLKSKGFPAGYQTLCCNHNHKKEIIRSRNRRKTDYPFHK
jgi:hypothetical protein